MALANAANGGLRDIGRGYVAGSLMAFAPVPPRRVALGTGVTAAVTMTS